MYNADIQPSMRHFAYFAVEIRLMVAATSSIFRKIQYLSELRPTWGRRCRPINRMSTRHALFSLFC